MVGRGGNLQLAGLEELLIAAIQQPGDLAVQQPAGASQYLDRPSGAAAISAAQPYFLT